MIGGRESGDAAQAQLGGPVRGVGGSEQGRLATLRMPRDDHAPADPRINRPRRADDIEHATSFRMADQVGKAPPWHSEPFIIGAHHGVAAPQPGVEHGHHVADGLAGRNSGCSAASGHARRPRRPADHRPATTRRPATRDRDRSRNCYRAPVQGCRAIKHQPRPGASSQPHVARRGPNPDRRSVHLRQRRGRPVKRHPCWSRSHTVSSGRLPAPGR